MQNGIYTGVRFSMDHNSTKMSLCPGFLVLCVLLLGSSPGFSSDAELTNLVIRNSDNQLKIDLTINGIFTEEMKMASNQFTI